ncbi:MAG: hypothetical protein QF450_10740 [Rhodospirillales bacterium]|jgi:hypothetical protein|nr:hypothetical protein [Rhodospirillales bacterium]HJO71647.1 hypothetical protein [Rhodospirillales bacterium]
MAEEDDAVEEQAEEPSDAEAAEAAAFAAAARDTGDAAAVRVSKLMKLGRGAVIELERKHGVS